MRHEKVVLIGIGADPDLSNYVAGLSLPKRALSTPIDPAADSGIPSFVELWGEIASLRNIVGGWPAPVRAWWVAEHVPIQYTRSWASGTPSPGVRMLSSLYRLPDLDREAFAAHWLGPHAAVAKSYTIACWHYNQNVVIEALTDDAKDDAKDDGEGSGGEDGFVGMHFESRDQLESRWSRYPDEAARGAEDAARFMDVKRSQTVVAVETVWDDA